METLVNMCLRKINNKVYTKLPWLVKINVRQCFHCNHYYVPQIPEQQVCWRCEYCLVCRSKKYNYLKNVIHATDMTDMPYVSKIKPSAKRSRRVYLLNQINRRICKYKCVRKRKCLKMYIHGRCNDDIKCEKNLKFCMMCHKYCELPLSTNIYMSNQIYARHICQLCAMSITECHGCFKSKHLNLFDFLNLNHEIDNPMNYNFVDFYYHYADELKLLCRRCQPTRCSCCKEVDCTCVRCKCSCNRKIKNYIKRIEFEHDNNIRKLNEDSDCSDTDSGTLCYKKYRYEYGFDDNCRRGYCCFKEIEESYFIQDNNTTSEDEIDIY